MIKEYTLDGKVYKTQKAVAEAYGISPQILNNRINKQKMTLEQAVSTPIKKPSERHARSTSIQGTSYTSFKSACEEKNENPGTIRSRIASGIKQDDAFNGVTRRTFDYKNKMYASRKKCIEELGLDYIKIKNYVHRKKCTYREAIEHYDQEKMTATHRVVEK